MIDLHTFVVLAYKESGYIADCIGSLLNQTIKSKIILTTSTPSFYLKNIADQFNIPLLINPEKKNIACDWNFAFKNCDTKYLTLAHQDDIYKPEYLENCLNTAEKYPDNLITFTDYDEIYQGKIRKITLMLLIKKLLLWPYLFKNAISNPIFKRLILSFGSSIPCPSVLYNLVNLINFKFEEEFSINLDWDAWLRLSKKKRELYLY